MSKEDGGPAFPVADYDHMVFEPKTVAETKRDLSGMSLRDYFAAKALPTAWTAFADGYFEADGWDSINEGVAVCAYQMADAMLAARSA
ncbi:hypothetical protein IB241_15785 [Pseudomonas sp. PDM05]|uniref:hypothetical protein n=1 Tax=Pseudomonas sp. PDM05 TaxID=2769301 RepID=UPI00177CA29E|nr:hypothetical protein [Pseudomonas sp. PDM05]MBD9459143.1 hypothetical protein [Pseudomonas sp. PDM05]